MREREGHPMPWRLTDRDVTTLTDRDVTTWIPLSSRRIADRLSANVIYSQRPRPFSIRSTPGSSRPPRHSPSSNPGGTGSNESASPCSEERHSSNQAQDGSYVAPGHLIENCLRGQPTLAPLNTSASTV